MNAKQQILCRIRDIEAKNIIDEINRLLDINFDDIVCQLSEDQQREIEQAREEIQRGEGISSEQIDKEIDEWLNDQKKT